MPEFYTWTILLINQLGEIGEKQLSVFGSRTEQNRTEGPNLPLNARTPLNVLTVEMIFQSNLNIL